MACRRGLSARVVILICWLVASGSLVAQTAERRNLTFSARHDGGYDIYVESLPEKPSSTWIEPGTGMEFSLIPAGEFVMGSPVDEPGHESQEVQHTVTISQPFYMAKHEVTQAQWRKVMDSNPSLARDCGHDCPVDIGPSLGFRVVREVSDR